MRPTRRGRGRLVAAVLIIDVIGAAALAFALLHHSHSHSPATASTLSAATVTSSQTPSRHAYHVQPPPRRRPRAPRHSTVHTHHSVARHRRATTTPSTSAATGASFAALEAREPGRVGLAIAPLGRGAIRVFGTLQADDAWSTMKVPVLATVLGDLERRGARLSPSAAADATRALEQSDNAAINQLFAGLESQDGGLVAASADVQTTLRRAGDTTTSVNTAPNNEGFSTFGQTDWSARGEVTFYRALARGCVLAPSDTGYVLGLMRHVESDQRWGAGSGGFPSSLPLAFKGGWGPEQGGDYLVRQSAIVGAGNRGWVFSMLARPSDGSFTSGTQMLTQIASWVARTFPQTHPSADESCR